MKRQTVSQPSIEGYQYTLLEQKGEENLYRLTARIKGDTTDTVGDLVTILGTDEEINQKIGSNVTNISPQEQFERKLDQQVNERSNELDSTYLNFREKNPYIAELLYNDRHGGDIRTLVSNIKDFVKINEINKDGLSHLIEKIKTAAETKGLKVEIRKTENLIRDYGERGLIFNITRLQEEEEMQKYIEQQVSICANKLIAIFEKVENFSDEDKKKQQLPFGGTSGFNIINQEEGRNAILELVTHKGVNKGKLLDSLKDKLTELGFESSGIVPINNSSWFSIKRKDDPLQNAA